MALPFIPDRRDDRIDALYAALNRARSSAPKRRTPAPSAATIERWLAQGYAKTPCGCIVEPDGTCEHGEESWLLKLGIV